MGSTHVYPLGKGRSFNFVLPPEGIDSMDVGRIIYHLFTLCTDFDPFAPPQVPPLPALLRK